MIRKRITISALPTEKRFILPIDVETGSVLGRKRKKIIRVFRRTMPKVFGCPSCGVAAVRVTRREDNVVAVACGSCKLSRSYENATRKEFIDVYNTFVDEFMAGKIGV